MVDIIIIAVVFVLLLFALRSSVRHFKGEKTCCSGGSREVREKRLDGPVLGSFKVRISGMHCENCARRIEDALQSLDVIAKAELPSTVIVRSKHPLNKEACSKAVREAGYEVIEAQI